MKIILVSSLSHGCGGSEGGEVVMEGAVRSSTVKELQCLSMVNYCPYGDNNSSKSKFVFRFHTCVRKAGIV